MGMDSGGSTVQSVDPQASQAAADAMVQSANIAAKQYEKAINQAISLMTNQFQQAHGDLRPYRMEGIQALNQINKYMGLAPYDPGEAPIAPIAPKTTTSQVSGLLQQQNQPMLRAEDMATKQNRGGVSTQDYWYNEASKIGLDPRQLGKLGGMNQYRKYADAMNRQNALNQLVKGQLSGGQTVQTAPSDQALQDYQNKYQGYQQNLGEYNSALQQQQQFQPMTAEQLQQDISNEPGFQAQLGQGISTIEKSASARGLLGSGALLKELNDLGQAQLSTYYGNKLTRLSNLLGGGQAAATGTAQGNQALGQGLAGLYEAQGSNQSNATLAAGQARASAFQQQGTTFDTVGGSPWGSIGSLLGGFAGVSQAGGFGAMYKNLKP